MKPGFIRVFVPITTVEIAGIEGDENKNVEVFTSVVVLYFRYISSIGIGFTVEEPVVRTYSTAPAFTNALKVPVFGKNFGDVIIKDKNEKEEHSKNKKEKISREVAR